MHCRHPCYCACTACVRACVQVRFVDGATSGWLSASEVKKITESEMQRKQRAEREVFTLNWLSAGGTACLLAQRAQARPAWHLVDKDRRRQAVLSSWLRDLDRSSTTCSLPRDAAGYGALGRSCCDDLFHCTYCVR